MPADGYVHTPDVVKVGHVSVSGATLERMADVWLAHKDEAGVAICVELLRFLQAEGLLKNADS